MFEDSTFESQGRIHTRSRAWMMATFAFNGSILLALVLIPLFYPEALPRTWVTILMEAPPAPAQSPKPTARVEHANVVKSEIAGSRIFAPSVIPKGNHIPDSKETIESINAANMDLDNGAPDDRNLFGPSSPRTVVRQVTGPVQVPSSLVEGLLIQRTVPIYPPIAVAARTEGTVSLQATISRSGTIENLHVVSGPIMLRQAAINAVQNWRYRPYLLNGNPVEVETTVNVIFKLQ